MKIGILGHDFITWGGGVDFLRFAADSLLSCPRSERVEFHLFIPDSGPRLAWRRFRGGVKATTRRFLTGKKPAPEHAPSSAILSQSFAEFRNRLRIEHLDVGRRALIRATRRLKLDAVIPAVHSLGSDFPCPWVAYAYDFQHRYFPQHFTPEDCRSRDDHFAEILTQARAVIVNSRAAAADIARFVPQGTARVFALPFSPAPSPDWFDDRPATLPRYGVVPPYFIISNQFWAHKDHATAFEAFRILATGNPAITLVCTGSTAGSLDPDHFPRLVSKLESWGLSQRVRILGLIPKRDQIEIMKHACAVIQPSVFEGGPGGGSVYDAVSLDVPAIVSDIPVNREVEGPAVEFFTAGDAAALAEKMKARLKATHQRASPADLLSNGRRQRAACGAMLWSAIDCVR
jgi:glycosyltransferase involved in cell wall biosynthesis